MLRGISISLSFVLVWVSFGCATIGRADSWASKQFDSLEHDFGLVRRGTVLNRNFVLTNNGSGQLRICRIRVTCGCTRVVSLVRSIEPGQSVFLDVAMDTSRFLGSKSVTVFVDFDQPCCRQVALRLRCESAEEIAQDTHEIDFGILPAKGCFERRMFLNASGRAGWRIDEIEADDPHLQAKFVECSRSDSQVRYELIVALKDISEPGKFEGRLSIRTNDSCSPNIIVLVKAMIEESVIVVPNVIRFAGPNPGQKISKQLIVKAGKPFRIIKALNTGNMFEVLSTPTPKTVQLVVLKLTVPEDPTTIPDHIDLITDLEGKKIVTVAIENQ